MPFYNTTPPTPTSKNTINSVAVDYGIRDFLLNKNLLPVYPFLSTSLNGSPKIGEPVLDTTVGTGNVVQPYGLPLETEGILRMEIAVIQNKFKNTSSTASSLLSIDNIPPSGGAFPNSTFPNGITSYPTSSNPDVFNYGIMGKTVDAGYRKNATIKNLYLDASQQVDVGDWIDLQTAPYSQQIKGYLDQYGALNLGGSPSIQAASVIGSVLNGQGLGLAKGGVVTNFDVRSSLIGRVLGATGAINDTKLGMIGGQQLALALSNNAAFNLEQQALGALNAQDNILSLVKNGNLAGFRPNYQITVPSSTGGKVADYTARILGFTLPKSYLGDAGSIFLNESNSANIQRANSMILNTGKGQVTALISNIFANINGTTLNDNPNNSPFRTGYVPGYKDNKGQKAINPSAYAFMDADGNVNIDGIIRQSGSTKLIPELSYNRSGLISQYGFTGPEENVGANNPYSSTNSDTSSPTLKHPTFTWGSDVGGTVNSETSPFGGNIVQPFLAADKKKSLLAKTQLLFNDKGMKNIVSGFGDIDSNIIPSQIQSAVVGGGISKGSAVMSTTRFDDNGHYTGQLDTPANTYCRTWTTNLRYDAVTNLVRSSGLSDVVPYRFNSINSSIDQYGFPKISPYSTDSFKVGDPKNYMFSIENLAWADTWQNLIKCEVGPGDLLSGKRGRIMWFPPYDIKFTENSTVNWEANNFIGRGESIYTYNNTERSGTLSFSIIVDHPSYVNSFAGATGPDDHYIASFFAGCVDPSSKFADKLTVTEISEISKSTTKTQQQKVVENQPTPPAFSIYFPNDIAILPDQFQSGNYESGLSGGSSTDTIDYSVNPQGTGFGIGTYTGTFTPGNGTGYTDNANYGYNGKSNGDISPISLDGNQFNGYQDPNFISTLNKFLNDKCPACVVEVAGYASQQGQAPVNSSLANARADNVITYLKTKLHTNKKGSDLDKRFKKLSSKAITDSQCQKDGPTDSKFCKADRKAMISFRFDYNLAAADVAQPEPIVKENTRTINSKITNRLYTECSYFEQLTDKDSFIFDKFREKIKYFHPAFHSTTPEGLNSRLTFLNQCTRQGPTLEEQGANNLAFGRPPVCILRIGDFYNTKIIIENMNVDYDPLVWDLNPEGIGLQPMIAKVSLGFKFIGGSTLMGPLNKLQNALSFNYYANTQVYDPRADYIAKQEPAQLPTTVQNGTLTANALKPWKLVNGVEDINTLIKQDVTNDTTASQEINQTAAAANEASSSTASQANNAANPVNSATTASTSSDVSRISISRIDSITNGLKIFFQISSPGTSQDLNFRATLSLPDGTLREIGVGKILKTNTGDVQEFSFTGVVNGLVDGKSYQVPVKVNDVPITSGLYVHSE